MPVALLGTFGVVPLPSPTKGEVADAGGRREGRAASRNRLRRSGTPLPRRLSEQRPGGFEHGDPVPPLPRRRDGGLLDQIPTPRLSCICDMALARLRAAARDRSARWCIRARWLLLALAAALPGCAAPFTTLVNDEGRRAHCGYSGWGVWGVVGAAAMHRHCVTKNEAAGFRPLPSKRVEARTSAAPAPSPAP